MPESFEINFNLVVKNIEELNLLSGADRTVIARTKGGATLKVELIFIIKEIDLCTLN